MKRSKKIIVSIALILLTMFILTSFTLQTEALNPNDPKWNPNPRIDPGGGFLDRVGTVLGWIQFIGILVAVVTLSIIGLKYMFSSVEGKAEYKKTMIPYVVGCFMLVGISALIEIIEKLAKI